MHTSDLTLGFIPIARTTFDIPLAEKVTARVRAQLEAAGLVLSGPGHLVTSQAEADAAASLLDEVELDLVLVFQSTFADSTMAVSLARRLDAPLLLWAIPEAPNGARLRLNSLCGINLAGHALRRTERHYDTVYASPDDAAALDKVRTLARAGRARRLLRGTRIGRIGEHPDGFETCIPHPDALQKYFGVELVQLDLPTVFEAVRVADTSHVEQVYGTLDQRLSNLGQMEPDAVRGTLGTYLTLHDMAEQQDLSGFAVRCWPQFFTELGCAACGALSMLNDEHIPASCETDVNGTVTQLILQGISGREVFGSDIVSFDMDANTAVFWHCGKAPLSMADPDTAPRATVHSNRKMPLLMEFPLRPGRVTLARLSEATGEYRLVIGTGEVIKAPISFSGTSGVVRFDRPARDVLDTILGEGLEHHLALVYGDHVDALLAFARMVDIPVLQL